MTTKTYEKLLENSIHSILSAIEVYNKPDFKYREEVFVILLINSWELLLKSKIIKDNHDQILSIFAIDKENKPKLNRSGNNMTIDLGNAMTKLSLQDSIKENITCLMEIRDTAVHFYNDDSIDYLVYTLSAASIRNYEKLTFEWFGRSLTKYNFYILPIGFSYNFQTITPINLRTKPEAIKSLLTSASEIKQRVDESKGYLFTCEISANIVSAKKIIDNPDITVSIDPNATTEAVIIQKRNLIELYPFTYTELFQKIKQIIPGAKQGQFQNLINKIKRDSRYSAYNFSTKKKQEMYESKGILKGVQIIYNQNALTYLVDELKRQTTLDVK